ncbi:MAG: hypothetical protein MSA07_00830 [Mucispirillum sp.]|nr:hypothetical protein [Mucispirillum sp.]
MKKQILIALFGIFVLAACSGENPNSDLYDKSNLAYASQAIIPANDPTFDASKPHWDSESGSVKTRLGPQAINLAVQWGGFIDNQTMLGVYFPHDIHRINLKGTMFLNKQGQEQKFVGGCVSCHDTSNWTNTTDYLFMQNKFVKTNTKIAGTDESNPGHEFCWTTCHDDIAEPNNAPSRNQCSSCHRVENTRK